MIKQMMLKIILASTLKYRAARYSERRIVNQLEYLPVPDGVAWDVGHVFVKHDLQFRIYVTYPLDSVPYHVHLSFLQRVYLVEFIVEKLSKSGAVVHEETIVYLSLGESIVAELGVIRG